MHGRKTAATKRQIERRKLLGLVGCAAINCATAAGGFNSRPVFHGPLAQSVRASGS